jgi:hypothetical protein
MSQTTEQRISALENTVHTLQSIVRQQNETLEAALSAIGVLQEKAAGKEYGEDDNEDTQPGMAPPVPLDLYDFNNSTSL